VQHTNKPPFEVVISHLYERHHVERLIADFPEVSFTQLPAAAPWPEVVSRANAMLFAGLKKPELSALLRGAPQLKWLHTGSAGFDWVLVPEVEAQGIVVTRSLDVMSIPMAEFVLAAMLQHAKNLPKLAAAQARREWTLPLHQELRGKEVLVVGAGSIGTRVAGLCRAFGMRVVGVNRSGGSNAAFDELHTADALDRLLPSADYVVLTAPGTSETQGLLDARRFGLMKQGAYLVNVARGTLVVEDALLAALTSGRLAGACLDAYAVEPLPEDSPLWSAENLFISPHTSYRTPEIRGRVFDEFAANLRSHLAGGPLAGLMRNPTLGY
jgi:phosphoglycerate dehydrogenase-like enzyme